MGLFVQPLLWWKSNMCYIFWVCVCTQVLGTISHAPYCHLWPARHDFLEKKMLLNTKCVSSFSLQILSEIFLIQRRIQRGVIRIVPEVRATKKIFKWNPLTTRPRGRPKYRWEDIIQDLGQMKIKNWLTCVQDRAKWEDVVEKAKSSS